MTARYETAFLTNMLCSQENCTTTHYHIKPDRQINLNSYLEEDI